VDGTESKDSSALTLTADFKVEASDEHSIDESLLLEDIEGKSHEATRTENHVKFSAIPLGPMILQSSHSLIHKVDDYGVTAPSMTTPVYFPQSVKKQYLLKTKTIHPPVIVNLRKDRNAVNDPTARDLLSQEELNYYKNNGDNATVFIHGFNVKYGAYGHDHRVVNWQHKCSTSVYHCHQKRCSNPPYLETTGKSIDMFRNKLMLEKRYAEYKPFHHPDFFKQVDFDNLNGSAAHSWFVYLENTLNKLASGLSVDEPIVDYSKFTRLINVAWSGDVFITNYIDAEDIATNAGIKLAETVKQLLDAGIAVNIIAHSLGNRVLLTVMNILGQQPKYQNKLEHVFMWQPAVPDTALSNKLASDTSILKNWNFTSAYKSAKKIVVLHSEQDNILGHHASVGNFFSDLWGDGNFMEAVSGAGIKAIPITKVGSSYELATQVGGSFSSFKNIGRILKGHARNKYQEYGENMDAFLAEIKKDDIFGSGGIQPEDLSPEAYEFFQPILYVHRLEYESAKAYCKAVKAVAVATANTEFKDVEPRPAMGYSGPEINEDAFVRKMNDTGKLSIVNQKDWLSSHSGMQIPSEDLYDEVYKKIIWEQSLMQSGFGRY
jgi:hypothetical protein